MPLDRSQDSRTAMAHAGCFWAAVFLVALVSAGSYLDSTPGETLDRVRNTAILDIERYFTLLDTGPDGAALLTACLKCELTAGVLSRQEIKDAPQIEEQKHKGGPTSPNEEKAEISLFEVTFLDAYNPEMAHTAQFVQCITGFKQPRRKDWSGLTLADVKMLWSQSVKRDLLPRVDDLDNSIPPMSDVCYPDPLLRYQESSAVPLTARAATGSPVRIQRCSGKATR